MKRVGDGLYRWKGVEEQMRKGILGGYKPKMVRVVKEWHDCKEYKGRYTTRVELIDNGSYFFCPHCGFTHNK